MATISPRVIPRLIPISYQGHQPKLIFALSCTQQTDGAGVSMDELETEILNQAVNNLVVSQIAQH